MQNRHGFILVETVGGVLLLGLLVLVLAELYGNALRQMQRTNRLHQAMNLAAKFGAGEPAEFLGFTVARESGVYNEIRVKFENNVVFSISSVP